MERTLFEKVVKGIVTPTNPVITLILNYLARMPDECVSRADLQDLSLEAFHPRCAVPTGGTKNYKDNWFLPTYRLCRGAGQSFIYSLYK